MKTLHHSRRGFSLIEMLIALVVLGVVVGAALKMFRSQSIGFRKGGASMDLHQNARYTASTLDRVVRTLGAGTALRQPMLVYGSTNVLVFNANYASDIQDGNAVYINPNLPANAVDGLTTGNAITIYGTAVTYPSANYFWGTATPTRAETIEFYFQPDASTPNPNDMELMQRVNNGTAEMVSRNLLPYPSRPFFEYWWDSLTVAGTIQPKQVAASRLPIYHSVAQHGQPTDVGASAFSDSVRSMRVNFLAWNGRTGADSVARLFSTMIRMPNNGLVQLPTCGDVPLAPGPVNAVVSAPVPGQVTLNWTRSGDEIAAEKDVQGYNIYWRPTGTPDWTTLTTQAAGLANYSVTFTWASGPPAVEFAVAAQDCTPQESNLVISNSVTIP
jgi:prepilin-type N-terminal cleavage/methylation domain-containing protein